MPEATRSPAPQPLAQRLTVRLTLPPVGREGSRAAALPGYPQSRLLRQAHGLWLQARGAREMPGWDMLSPLLPAAMRPLTVLFAAVHEPFDFRYAEIGSRMHEIGDAGHDHVGRLLSDLPQRGPPNRMWDHLSAAVDARAPIRGLLPSPLEPGREPAGLCHIVLPLADDGERVDRLLVCVDAGPAIRLEDGTHPFTQLGTSFG